MPDTEKLKCILLYQQRSCFSSSELSFSQEFGLTNIFTLVKLLTSQHSYGGNYYFYLYFKDGETEAESDLLLLGKLRHRVIVVTVAAAAAAATAAFGQRHTA